MICIAIDDRAAAVRIVEITKAEFPLAKVFARAYDLRGRPIASTYAPPDDDKRAAEPGASTFGRVF